MRDLRRAQFINGDVMDFPELLRDYGWVAVLLMWLVPRLFQFFTDKFYPARVAEIQREQTAREEGVKAEREARATLIKAQIDREEREASRRLLLEERMVTSLEQMALGISVGNERIAAMIASQTSHHNFVFGSHADLKEKMDKLENLVTARREIDHLKLALKETQEKMRKPDDETNEAGTIT